MKPCPFCGSSRLENLDAAAAGGAVYCIDCGARGPRRFDALSLDAAHLRAHGRHALIARVANGLEAWDVRTSGTRVEDRIAELVQSGFLREPE